VSDAPAADVLKDLLRHGLKAVFCGTQAGSQSARRGAYYAGRGNRFWSTLHDIGLTPVRLAPEQYAGLLAHGIGLTDVAKKTSGADSLLRRTHVDVTFFEKIEKYAPRMLAFNGKRAASLALKVPGPMLGYGRQSSMIGKTALFVLPSTSGAASGFWDVRHWHDFAGHVGAQG
jgi:TDG/mug DNA glycosylase family protein